MSETNIEIPKTLSKEYAHSNQIAVFREKIPSRDEHAYENLYEKLGAQLCMLIDRDRQTSLLRRLRRDLQLWPRDGHSDRIGQYWQNLEKSSIYPTFKKKQQELRVSGEIEKEVESWSIDKNPTHRDYNYVVRSATHVFPYIAKPELAREAVGWQKSLKRFAHIVYFRQLKDFGININDSQLGNYITSLFFLVSARRLSERPFANTIKEFNSIYSMKHYSSHQKQYQDWMNSTPEKIDETLRASEPYHYVADQLSIRIRGLEKILFGENSALPSILWKATTFLRTSKLPGGVSGSSVRQPLLQMLIENRYDEARFYIEDLMVNYPGILPDFEEDRLDIEPKYLKTLYSEESEELKAERERKMQERFPKRQTQNQILKQKNQMDREPARELMRELVGKTFYNTKGEPVLVIIRELKEKGFRAKAPSLGLGSESRSGNITPEKLFQLIAENGLSLNPNPQLESNA